MTSIKARVVKVWDIQIEKEVSILIIASSADPPWRALKYILAPVSSVRTPDNITIVFHLMGMIRFKTTCVPLDTRTVITVVNGYMLGF
ncbi:hypothetical protein J6590_106720, partial [Homalodisca vitripennis]